MSLENIYEYLAAQLMDVMPLERSIGEKMNLISKLKNDTQRDIKVLIENAKRERLKLENAEFLNELYRRKQLEMINNKLKNDQFRSGIEVTPQYVEYSEVYIRERKSVRGKKRRPRERNLRIMEEMKEERMEEISRDINYLQNKLKSAETYLKLFRSAQRDVKALIIQEIESQGDTAHKAPVTKQEEKDKDNIDDFNVLSRMVGHWGCDY